jgi:hypothetical protein
MNYTNIVLILYIVSTFIAAGMTSPAGKYGFVEILTLFFSMLFLDYGMEAPPLPPL